MSQKCTCTERRRRVCGSLKCISSFAAHEKSRHWSKDNGNIKPHMVSMSAAKKYIFDCHNCTHKYSIALNHVVSENNGCAYCANQKLCDNVDCKECINKSFESHKMSLYFKISNKDQKGNKITPREIFINSAKEYEFECHTCQHLFTAKIYSVTYNNSWCPYCSHPVKKLCDNKDCEKCLNNSFASHKKAANWSNKNGKITPRDVILKSNKKYIFSCTICLHDFAASLGNISQNKWCPYCAIPANLLCEDKKCKYCYLKSFASNKKSQYLTNNNSINDPRMILKGSNKKYEFKCNDCSHIFTQPISSITRKNPVWCQYCSGHLLCGIKSCRMCTSNSFAGSPRAAFLSKKNKFIPYTVFKNSGIKAIFDCDKCDNEFSAMLANISSGTWCPVCKNKTEHKLNDWLTKSIPVEFTHNVSFGWCKNKTYLPFDFCIEEYNIIIELDGVQHFTKVKLFKNCPIEALEDDMFKLKCAIEHGYTVIRLLQEDVWADKNNWNKRLLPYLRKHSTTKVILIDNKDEYLPMQKAINKTMEGIQVIKKFTPLNDDNSSSDSESEYETKPLCRNKKKKSIMKLIKPSANKSKSKIISESDDSDDESDSDDKTSKRHGKKKSNNTKSSRTNSNYGAKKRKTTSSDKKAFSKRVRDDSSDSE